MTKLTFASALAVVAAAAVPLGCTSNLITPATTVVGGNPLPMVNLGNQGATLTLNLDGIKQFATQATLNKVKNDITWYEIELIPDVASTVATAKTAGAAADAYSTSNLNTVKTGPYPSVLFDGPNTVSNPTGTLMDSGTLDKLQFTGVTPGWYRVRVKATDSMATTAALIDGTTHKIINKPDSFFTVSENWSISENVAEVGASVTYWDNGGGTASVAPELTVDIPLLDGMGDDTPVMLNVIPGAVPTINSSDV